MIVSKKSITRHVSTPADKEQLILLIRNQTQPFTCKVEQGILRKRSIQQNRLQRLWMLEAEEQGDQTAEEYRAYCKLYFGVPILYSQDHDFHDQWESRIKGKFTIEQMLTMMMIPVDLPVTRLMNTKQKKQYLDAIYTHFTGLGMQLTEPDDMMYQEAS